MDDLLDEQIAYYRARAPDHDRMLLRERRYDVDGLDLASPDRDTRELAIVEARLKGLAPFGDVLEIASGTGWWTKRLASLARSVTALDASPEMLRIFRRRVRAIGVRSVEADVFRWTPDRTYDLVFFRRSARHDITSPRGRAHIPDGQGLPPPRGTPAAAWRPGVGGRRACRGGAYLLGGRGARLEAGPLPGRLEQRLHAAPSWASASLADSCSAACLVPPLPLPSGSEPA